MSAITHALLGPWTAWDLQAEPYKGGEFEYLGRIIYLGQRPEGIFLARFLDVRSARVHRFFGETAELALEHAVDYIRDFLSGQERRLVVLEDSDSSARSLLERLNREYLERQRAAGILPR